MKNIDRVFEQDVDPSESEIFILPGLEEYRKVYNQGSFVMDARMGYQFNDAIKLNLIANNFLNAEYVSRPGDVQPPRSFIIQLQFNL